jgi:stearoyl-CoA desaturase (delta-9 desaturase)
MDNGLDGRGEVAIKRGGQDHSSKARLRHEMVISIIIFHLGCLAAPFTFSWSGVGLVIFLWWFTGGLGICIGFHRMLTHASFKTSRPVRYALMLLGCLANEGPPIVWVGTHRLHHRHSDHEQDPHSPLLGFEWGHVVWMFFYAHDVARRAARDLSRDRWMALIDRFYYVPTILLAGVLYLLGGWSWVVWGVFVRTVVVLHCTWFVNSAAHKWGYRNFETNDGSRNNWWVALLSFGEGWHNNHHAQQRSAAHGMKWWEFDPTFLTIRLLEAAGLIWDVHRPVMDDPAAIAPAGA